MPARHRVRTCNCFEPPVAGLEIKSPGSLVSYQGESRRRGGAPVEEKLPSYSVSAAVGLLFAVRTG